MNIGWKLRISYKVIFIDISITWCFSKYCVDITFYIVYQSPMSHTVCNNLINNKGALLKIITLQHKNVCQSSPCPYLYIIAGCLTSNWWCSQPMEANYTEWSSITQWRLNPQKYCKQSYSCQAWKCVITGKVACMTQVCLLTFQIEQFKW